MKFSIAEDNAMTTLSYLIVAAMLATVGALVLGIASMAHGGEYDQRHSHQFMFARVGFQGIALVLLMIGLWFAAH
jgi:hypothetical protein